MNRWIIGCFILALWSPASLKAQATLSPEALYTRCYGQITQRMASPLDPAYGSIRGGEVDPIDACMAMLEGVRLEGMPATLVGENSINRAILNSFHRLHASWFHNKFLRHNDARELFDGTSPALYVTRSLFSSLPASSILTSEDDLRPYRVNHHPDRGIRNGQKSSYALGDALVFADRGDLRGFEIVPLQSQNYTDRSDRTGTVTMRRSYGGGFLGSSLYLGTMYESYSRSDGGIRMPRRYGRDFFRDVLCRELPVVRKEDAAPFISSISSISFRTTGDCVRCHVSMDRAAAGVRNLRFNNIRGSGRTINTPYLRDPTRPSDEGAWPIWGDGTYDQKPPIGVLYYRDHAGQLVDRSFTSPAGLGRALQDLDDPYVCLAKRYYQYFTGFDVNISDLGDSDAPDLSEGHRRHRLFVIGLGQRLKSHQNLTRLIEEILKSSQYRQSDFY